MTWCHLKPEQQRHLAAHLELGGDEETGDAQKLQLRLEVAARGAEVAVDEVHRQVVRLPVQSVHLAHLQQTTSEVISTT